MPSPRNERLRRLGDEYAVIVVSAAALVWLAFEGGGYGEVARHGAGVLIWLFLFGIVLRRGGATLPRGPVLIVAGALAAFALLTGLSILWSESTGRSWDELTRVLTYLGLFLAVGAVGSDARRRGQLLDGLTLGVTVILIVALLSRLEPWLFHAQDLQRFAPEFRPRLAYPFDYWNAVGSLAAVAIVLLLHAAVRPDRPPRYGRVATALLPVAGLVLYLTFSRGSMIAVAVGCALLLWLTPRRLATAGAIAIGLAGTAAVAVLVRSYAELSDGQIESSVARSQGHRVLVALLVVSALTFAARRWVERSPLPGRVIRALTPHRRNLRVAALVFTVLALGVGGYAFVDRIESFEDPVVLQSAATQGVQTRLSSTSGNGRYQFWSASVNAWQARPVAGHGAGTWEFWWRRNATINAPTRDSHSLFFDVLAELGTVGAIALLALFGSVLWIAIAAARAAGGAARGSLAAIAGAAVTWTVGASIDWFWEFAALGAVFFALAALAATARRDQRARPDEAAAVATARGRPTRLAAALAFAAWLVVVVQAVGLTASWSFERSEKAVARDDLPAAEDAADLARRMEPWSAEPYMQLALVRVRLAGTMPSPQKLWDQAVADARDAVEREPTNWRTWLTLTRIEARVGRLPDAVRDNGKLGQLARGSPLVPTYQQLLDLSTSKDVSLSPESKINSQP